MNDHVSAAGYSMVDFLVNLLRPHYFRGKGRVLNRLIPRQGQRSTLVFDYRMDLDLSELIQRHIYLGVFEPKETALVLQYLKPGMTVVDIGANVGYYTLLAASCVGRSGRVIAVEPSPLAYQKLVTTVLTNRISQVAAFQIGIGDSIGAADLYLGSNANHSPTMLPIQAPVICNVPVRPLDDCIYEWGVERIDLLKVDVEGYEPRVFAGASIALTSRRIRAILCEFNDYWLRKAGSTPEALWQVLSFAGFVDAESPGLTPSFPSGCLTTRLLLHSEYAAVEAG